MSRRLFAAMLPILFPLVMFAMTALACTDPVASTPDGPKVYVNQAERDERRRIDATIEAHRRGWDQVIESGNNAQTRDWDGFNRSNGQ